MSNRRNYQIAFQLGANMNSSMRTAFANANRQLTNTNRNVTEINKNSTHLSKALGTIKKAAVGVGTALAGAFAVKKIADFGKDVMNTYMTFEQAMSKVKAVSGATGEDFEKLSAIAREMGKKTSKSAAEAADGLQYLALAGWNTEQMMQGIEPVLRLSEAGALDLGRASDLVTDSMAALGIEVQDLTSYMDKVAQTSRKSNTNIDALMEAFLVAGGTFKTFNVPLEEANSILGIMANRGYKGAEAGTALNAIVTNLTSGAGRAGQALKKLNLSAFDSKGKFKGLENVLLEVKGKIDGMSDAQKAQYIAMIAGKEHLKTFTGIMDGLGKEYQDLKGHVIASDGALQEMADTQMDNLIGAFTILESAISEAKIAIGEKFAPSLRKSVDWITARVPQVQAVIEKGIDKVGKVFSNAKKVISGFTKDIPIKEVFQAFKYLSGGYEETRKQMAKFGDTLEENLGSKTMKIVSSIRNGIDVVKSTFQQLKDKALNVFRDFAPAIGSYINTFLNAGTKLKEKLIEKVDFRGILNSFSKGFKAGFSIFTKLQVAVIKVAEKIIQVINPVFLFIAEKAVPIVVDAFQFVAGTVVPKLGDAFQKWIPKIQQILTGLADVFTLIWEYGIKPTMDRMLAIFNFVWPVIKDIVVIAIDTISSVVSGLMSVLGGIIDFVVGVFTGDWDRAWQGVKNIFGGIFESLAGLVKGPMNAVIAVINGAIRGINSISIDVPDWVPMLGGKNFSLKIPEIPMLAKGGITTGPTLAMIGEGAEQEAVLPLSKLDSLLKSPTHHNNSQAQIIYSPTLIIQGNATKADVEAVQQRGQQDFERWYRELQADKERLSFGKGD